MRLKNNADNTKNHTELKAALNTANTSAIILLHDTWPVVEEYERQKKRCVLYCRFFVLVINCSFLSLFLFLTYLFRGILFLLISDVLILKHFFLWISDMLLLVKIPIDY